MDGHVKWLNFASCHVWFPFMYCGNYPLLPVGVSEADV